MTLVNELKKNVGSLQSYNLVCSIHSSRVQLRLINISKKYIINANSIGQRFSTAAPRELLLYCIIIIIIIIIIIKHNFMTNTFFPLSITVLEIIEQKEANAPKLLM